MRNPIQPLVEDEQGVIRFKENKIVSYLLDNGGIDMNQLAVKDFSEDDRRQFAQLIGYSLSGFGSLPYVNEDTYDAAERMLEDGQDEKEARLAQLENEISVLRRSLREPMARLFDVHPDDLRSH